MFFRYTGKPFMMDIEEWKEKNPASVDYDDKEGGMTLYKFYEKPKTFEEFKSTINHYFFDGQPEDKRFEEWLNSKE